MDPHGLSAGASCNCSWKGSQSPQTGKTDPGVTLTVQRAWPHYRVTDTTAAVLSDDESGRGRYMSSDL